MTAIALLNKKEGFTPKEYITQKALVYFSMKKIKDDSLEKVMSEDNT